MVAAIITTKAAVIVVLDMSFLIGTVGFAVQRARAALVPPLIMSNSRFAISPSNRTSRLSIDYRAE